MKIGNVITVYIPNFYSANIEFWEMYPQHMCIKRFTKRGNLVIGNLFISYIFDKHSGQCVSHIKSTQTPKHFRRAYIPSHLLT